MSDDQAQQKNPRNPYRLILFYGAATTLLAVANLLIRMNLIANGVRQSDFVMMLSYGLLLFGIAFLAIGLVMLKLKK
jgi:hypothetical protein